MLVRHKDSSFSGSVVAATKRFEFVDGVADVDLTPAQVAAIGAKGWTLSEEAAVEVAEEQDAEVAETVHENAEPVSKPKRFHEIGSHVDPADMEQPEPEIG